MIIPCIDLMDGKVVQLVQGREKVLEGKSPDEMLDLFAAFPRFRSLISMPPWEEAPTFAILKHLASRASIRAGGGVRTVARAEELCVRAPTASLSAPLHSARPGPTLSFHMPCEAQLVRQI